MEGVLTEDFVSSKASQLVSVLREANTSIRWLLLQPTTQDTKLAAISGAPKSHCFFARFPRILYEELSNENLQK